MSALKLPGHWAGRIEQEQFLQGYLEYGAGFWDRGLGERGERLSKACEPYGSVYLYVDEQGRVCL